MLSNEKQWQSQHFFTFTLQIFLYSITGKTMNGFDFLKKLLTILLTNLYCKSKRLARLRPWEKWVYASCRSMGPHTYVSSYVDLKSKLQTANFFLFLQFIMFMHGLCLDCVNRHVYFYSNKTIVIYALIYNVLHLILELSDI